MKEERYEFHELYRYLTRGAMIGADQEGDIFVCKHCRIEVEEILSSWPDGIAGSKFIHLTIQDLNRCRAIQAMVEGPF